MISNVFLARVGPGVLFGVLLGGLLGAFGSPWGHLGVTLGDLGVTWDPLGLLWGAPGRPRDSILRDLDVFLALWA